MTSRCGFEEGWGREMNWSHNTNSTEASEVKRHCNCQGLRKKILEGPCRRSRVFRQHLIFKSSVGVRQT